MAARRATSRFPYDAFKARLLDSSMAEPFAQGFIDMVRAKNEGMDDEGVAESGRPGADDVPPMVRGEA